MKVVKVRITRNPDPTRPRLKYPARYNAQEVDRNGLGPLNLNQMDAYSGGILKFGGTEEHCLIALEDALADEYALDPDMEVITAAEADTLMAQWHQKRVAAGFEPQERITDSQRIEAIRVKQTAGVALSAEDLRALDPTDPTPGINSEPRKVATRVSSR